MYVKRLKLFGVRGFRFDLPRGGGELPQATRKHMLLQGGNGSGKSTVIETIAGLWDWFGKMIDEDTSSFSCPSWSGELSAMELGDFPDKGLDLWIAIGTADGIETLRKAHPRSPMACIRHSGKDYRIEMASGGGWKTVKIRSQEGVDPLPNVVYFPSEGRSVPHAPRGVVKRLDLYQPNWLARYDAEYDLDSLLFTIRAKQPDRYAESLRYFNQMLASSGKRVSSEEGRQGRLHIERFDEEPRSPPHPWTALSSGERQMLLMVVYTVCLLREDSILLIDEPDLHIHIGMVKQLLDTLDSVAEKRRSQMIIAGHSQQLWDWFGLKAEKISLGPWRNSA